MRRIAILRPALAAGLLLAARMPAGASTEDFSTFAVEAQEEDDESLLDHFQARFPEEWLSDWSGSRLGFRTSQGCLTSGQWLTETQVRLDAPVGGAVRFGFELHQRLSDEVSLEYYDLSVWSTLHPGTRLGAYFRPFHDKARQDIGLLWALGSDSAGLAVRGAFTLEDMFNNFWAFRQTRVGNTSEPYQRRPYEPALHLAWRGGRLRAEAGGLWLTPSRKRVEAPAYPDSLGEVRSTLWGAEASARLGWHGEGTALELWAWGKQARATLGPERFPLAEEDYRRQWRAEGSVTRRMTARVAARARAGYGERLQRYAPDPALREFRALDRYGELSAEHALAPWISARAGLLAARIGVVQLGGRDGRITSHGTRTESRVFVGFRSRVGNLWLAVAESFELDSEPYDVWFIHDKAFFQVMARF